MATRARARGTAARRSPRRNPNGGRRKPTGTILDAITAGDRVRIRDRFGQEREGRAVMLGPAGWVLNMGGKHGTPGIATPDNIVRIRPAARRRNPALQHEGNGAREPKPGAYRGYMIRAHPITGAVWIEKDGRLISYAPGVAAAQRIVDQLANPGRARGRAAARSNPGAWSGHASVRGGELFSRRVLRLEYDHVDDPPGRARFHDFGPGVFMYAMKDGTVLLRHREHPRKRVWADLPDKARR